MFCVAFKMCVLEVHNSRLFPVSIHSIHVPVHCTSVLPCMVCVCGCLQQQSSSFHWQTVSMNPCCWEHVRVSRSDRLSGNLVSLWSQCSTAGSGPAAVRNGGRIICLFMWRSTKPPFRQAQRWLSNNDIFIHGRWTILVPLCLEIHTLGLCESRVHLECH